MTTDTQIDDRKLPTFYTGCEVYRGYVIALSVSTYAFFDTRTAGMYTYVKGGFQLRAEARRAIDLECVS